MNFFLHPHPIRFIVYFQRNRDKPILKIFSWLIILFSLLIPVVLGILEVHDARAGFVKKDFWVLHEAGSMWLSGKNPYLSSVGPGGDAFAYSPTSTLLFQLLSLLPLQFAQAFFFCLNFFALFFLISLSTKCFYPSFSWKNIDCIQAVCIASIIGSEAVRSVFELGQTSILMIFVAYLAWYFYRRQRIIFSAFFIGLTTIKPQYTILIVFWLILGREIRLLLLSGVFCLIFLAPLLLDYSILQIFIDWKAAIDFYKTFPFNQWGSLHVSSLNSLLVSMGINHLFDLLPMSLLAAGMLYRYRAKLAEIWIFPLLILITLFFIFAHITAYAALIPVWCGLLFYSLNRHNLLLLVLFLSIMFNIPLEIMMRIVGVGHFDLNPIMHWRTMMLLVLAVLVCSIARFEKAKIEINPKNSIKHSGAS